MAGSPILDGYGAGSYIEDGYGGYVLDGYPTTPTVANLAARQIAYAAFFAAPEFIGRAPSRAVIAPSPPYVPPAMCGVQGRLWRYATHFAPDAFDGGRATRRSPFTFGGGAGNPPRASQIVVETLALPNPNVRASQLVVEALADITATVRASQLVVEALSGVTAVVRASQIVVEVLVPFPELAPVPIYPELAGLTYVVVKRPKNSTGVGTASSGREIRVAYWALPQWEWDLTYSVLNDNGVPNGTTESDIKTLIGFFLQVVGSFSPFYFRDPDDDAVTGQALGVADGTTQSFVFVRTYGLDFTGTEPVGMARTDQTINIYVGGVLQNPSTYTINASTPCGNYVTFTAAPVDGEITADFSFYYYCRLKDDSYDFNKLMQSLWDTKKITIFSLKN